MDKLTPNIALILLGGLLILGGCASEPRPEGPDLADIPRESIEPDDSRSVDLEALEAFAAVGRDPVYRIGPGDLVNVSVTGRPELGGEHRIGPDGSFALPLLGAVDAMTRTRDALATEIRERFLRFYRVVGPVSVDVTEYTSDRVYVLGRVENPGVHELTGAPRLLQVLAQAGGLPVREFRTYLHRCAILREGGHLLWIDLVALLEDGRRELDVELRNGDVVYLPDPEDAVVFVMGQVLRPGAVPIKVRLPLATALAHAGGPTEDADLDEVWLVRDGGTQGSPVRIDLRSILENADFEQNVDLRSGDILIVGRSGLGDLNYVLRKFAPSITPAAFLLSITQGQD